MSETYKGLTWRDLLPYGKGYPFGARDVSERVTEAWRKSARTYYEKVEANS